MGTRDADSGRGMDRTALEEITKNMHALKVSELNERTVGELFELLKMQSRTITELEGELDATKNKLRGRDPFGDPMLRATGIGFELDDDNKQVRLSFFHGAERDVVAWMTMDTSQMYDVSERLLKEYDRFEGIK